MILTPRNAAIRNQNRFNGKNVLVVSGERRQESPNRAKYKEFEPDTTQSRRINSWRWRPIIDWTEDEVWKIYEQFKVNPHPAYKLGWGRVSCLLCIFASDNQLASAYKLFPEKVERIAALEEQFSRIHQQNLIAAGKEPGRLTIHRKCSIMERVERGTPYSPWDDVDVEAAVTGQWNQPIFVENWKLPLGTLTFDNAGPY